MQVRGQGGTPGCLGARDCFPHEAVRVPRGQLKASVLVSQDKGVVLDKGIQQMALCISGERPSRRNVKSHVMTDREVGRKSKIRSPLANVAKKQMAATTQDVEMTDIPSTSKGNSSKPNGKKGGKKSKSKPAKGKPIPGSEGWEKFKKKRNKRRAEKKKLNKKNGKKSPYALYVDASGASSDLAQKIKITLTEWRILLQQAMVQATDDLMQMSKDGLDSPGEKLALAHQCFVEHNRDHPEGVPTSSMSADQRYGHGALFFDDKEAEIFMRRALRGCNVIREGRKFKLELEQKELDRRAVYSMVANRYIWESVKDRFWSIVKYLYARFPEGEPEVVHEGKVNRSEDLVCVAFRATPPWEEALDGMEERTFRTFAGKFHLRKKDEGIKPRKVTFDKGTKE